MSDPFRPRIGGVMSADIAVPEREREMRFYSRVLSTGQDPLWREDLMNNRGMPIIGLGPHTPEYADLPVQWMPHIQVANVSVSVERALGMGGSEVMHAKGEDGLSQWAVMLDPNGAAFGLIPVVAAEATPPMEGIRSHGAVGRVGCITWLDLTVPDASATRDFYRHVVGWSVQALDTDQARDPFTDYEMCAGNGKPVARICDERSLEPDLPSIWMIHLPVGDLAESLRHVQEEGGEIIAATQRPEGEYTRAIVRDPVGACLALVPG